MNEFSTFRLQVCQTLRSHPAAYTRAKGFELGCGNY